MSEYHVYRKMVVDENIAEDWHAKDQNGERTYLVACGTDTGGSILAGTLGTGTSGP